MALRMGDIMVNIRAQDFASRTLRRVSGEMAGLSRTQQIAFRGQELAFQRQAALSKVAVAQSDLRRLAYIKEAKALQTQVQAMRRYRAADAALRSTGGRAGRAGTFIAGTPEQRAELRASVAELSRMGIATRDVNRLLAEGEPRLERMTTRINKFSSGLRSAWNNQQVFGQNLFKSRQQLQAAYNQLSRADQAQIAFNNTLRNMPLERLDNVAHSISGIGRTMQLFGAIGTVAFGAAARSAANFSTELSLAATQMRDMGAPFSQVAVRAGELREGVQKAGVEIDGILGLMQKFPATSQDMTNAAYEIFSSMQLQRNGITDVAAGLGLLEKANMLAVAGGIDLKEATDTMIVTLNNFDPALRNVNAQLDTMMDIVRFGKMRVADFGKIMIPLAPAAANVGQSLEDIGGAISFLTERIASPERVGTGLARMLEALRHPDMVRGLRKFNIEVNDLATGRMRSLPELLKDIAEAFPGLRTGQLDAANFFRQVSALGRGGGRGQMFTIQGRRVLTPLMKQLEEYLIRQNQVIKNEKEFRKAFEAQIKTPGVQWAVFVNQLKALVLVIGQEAIPVFARVGAHINNFVEWFRDLDEGIRSQIIQWGAYIAIFTLVGGVFAAVFGSLLAFEAMLRRMVAGMGAASGTAGAFLMVLRRIAAIGAIVLVVSVIKGGDMNLWKLIMAAAAGAGIGLGVAGIPGAVAGALTLPLVLSIIAEVKKTPMEEAFADYKRQFVQEADGFTKWTQNNVPQFLGTAFSMAPFLPKPEKMMNMDEFKDEWARTVKFIKQNKLDPKSVDAFGRATLDAAKAQYPLIDAVLATMRATKKQKNGIEDLLKSVENDEHKKVLKEMLEAGQANADMLQKMYDEGNTGAEELINKEKELARVRKDAARQAIDSMKNMYMQLQGLNEQAMGELFQGPWLTSETFNLAKEWGIMPRIEDMIRDLTQQNARFAEWRKDLDALFKRGIPKEFIDELRQMGPEEGQAFIDALLTAKPGQVQQVIRQWNLRNEQIKEATKMDFTREIQAFRKAGVDMGEAIINGFQSADVGGWFDGWVQTKFPDIISSSVSKAVQEWRQSQPVPTQKAKPGRPVVAGGGGTTTNTNTVDNSKKADIKVELPGLSDAHDRHNYERARQAAFVMANAAERVFRK